VPLNPSLSSDLKEQGRVLTRSKEVYICVRECLEAGRQHPIEQGE